MPESRDPRAPRAPRADVLALLRELDARLEDPPREVWMGGGAAILLAYDGTVATVDIDLIGEKTGLLLHLSGLAPKGSALHRSTHLYCDVVPPGLFPSEFGWRSRAIAIDLPELSHLRIRVLEIHDLILSKLKRFSPKDREDIRHLSGRTQVDLGTLRERYRDARLFFDYDQREKLDSNFNLVETEFLGAEPSGFE